MAVKQALPVAQRVILLAAVLIAFGAIAAYLGTLSVPFIFDDGETITGNPTLRHLASALGTGGESTVSTASGRPVLNFSFALNYALGRYDTSGYHAMNIAIHLLAGLALFGLVRRTLKQPVMNSRFGPDSAALALAISLIWTLHPLQTESVTYVSQRAESLMGLFYFLVLYCFVRGADAGTLSPMAGDGLPVEGGASPGLLEKSGFWFGAAVVSCFLGAATKEVMVTAPVIVLLYDRTFIAGSFKGALRRRRWVYAGLAASWILLACLIASTGGNRGGSIGFGISVPWWKYALTQFRAVFTYLRLSVWPYPLIFDRGTYWAKSAWDVIPFAIPVLGLLGATVVALRRWPAAGFLGCWFFAILAPTSSIVPGTTQLIVEHRMYLPLAAVISFAVVGVFAFTGRRSTAIFVALSLPLGFLTSSRNADYRTTLSIWKDTVSKDPGNAYAQLNYGVALADTGDTPGAMEHYRATLALDPNSVEAHTNLANALLKTGHPEEASTHYAEALRLKPDYPQAHIDWGNALVERGRLDEGIAQYKEAIRLNPSNVEAQNNLGMALLKTGHSEEAVERFKAALELNPDFAPAEFNLGNALRTTGRIPEAVERYVKALKLKPDLVDASLNLGNLLMQQGDLAGAIVRYEQALRFAPEYAEARNSLGLALARSGRVADAVGQFQEALRLKPNYPAAQANLKLALQAQSRDASRPTNPATP